MSNLYKAKEYIIEQIQEEFNINIQKEKINNKKLDEIIEYIKEILTDYEVYNYDLFELARELYFKGYNLLEKAIEYNSDNLMLINDVLCDYIIDEIYNYQEKVGN